MRCFPIQSLLIFRDCVSVISHREVRLRSYAQGLGYVELITCAEIFLDQGECNGRVAFREIAGLYCQILRAAAA